jgi:hypothetical protein
MRSWSGQMSTTSDAVLDRVKVREVAGIFPSRESLEAGVDAWRAALQTTSLVG